MCEHLFRCRWFAAAQRIMPAHHRPKHWTLHEASVRSIGFEKWWRFVSADPVLADRDIEEWRARLSHRLNRLAQKGERDGWRLANGAIFELRRELTAA